jgi:hypothetical protein
MVQRLVLPDQVIALLLHLLNLIVVLGEGTIKLGLQQGGVLLGLVQLFLHGLSAEHCVAIPLKHVSLLSRSLNDILHKATH